MLKKLYFLIMLLVILFVFSGCEEFFTFNLFKAMDYVAVPSAQQINEKPPTEGVLYLQEQMTSDAFVNAVAENPESLAAITTYLQNVYQDSSQPEELQITAAVLAGDLNLATSGGDELINNVLGSFSVIMGMTSGTAPAGVTAAESVQSVLDALIPESIASITDPVEQKTAFTNLISGILTAGEIYSDLGNLITPTTVSADITGGVLMNAIVTELVTSVVDNLILPGNDAPAILWALYNSPTAETFATLEGIDQEANFDSVLSDLASVQNIAAAAGADIYALLGIEAPVAP